MYDPEVARLERENRQLRQTLMEQRVKPGIRVVIAHLHVRAAEMNHYPAKQWLNSLGFELGVYLKNGHLNVEAAIDASLRTVSAQKQPTPSDSNVNETGADAG